MFESLGDRLQGVFDSLRGRGRLTEAEVKVEILKQPVESVYLRLHGDLKIEQIEAVDQSMRIRGFVRKTEIKLGESGVEEVAI